VPPNGDSLCYCLYIGEQFHGLKVSIAFWIANIQGIMFTILMWVAT